MTPEVRDRVRKLRGKLCSLTDQYKGVLPESCQKCESPCTPGKELLKALGMERPAGRRMTDVFELVHHSRGRKAQKVIQAMNRRSR